MSHVFEPAQAQGRMRMALDLTTFTIMRILPCEVDPTVFRMQSTEEDSKGRRRVVCAERSPPLWSPGTSKALLAKALASNIHATFLKVVASTIANKYRKLACIIHEMFGFTRDHQPCVIFMDEIDAIGGESTYTHGIVESDDGFEDQGQMKMVLAKNRPDILDAAFLIPGQLDRKIEITESNES
ncbi:hypothetical protein HJC23_001950 [Cyclotella cryptica]|uniref:ATPase AAA-type core domain-containing protein n=1 Tax=Cyclotella cryptica TaxID=29204 RepID=A0ABD3PN46_9STRA